MLPPRIQDRSIDTPLAAEAMFTRLKGMTREVVTWAKEDQTNGSCRGLNWSPLPRFNKSPLVRQSCQEISCVDWVLAGAGAEAPFVKGFLEVTGRAAVGKETSWDRRR